MHKTHKIHKSPADNADQIVNEIERILSTRIRTLGETNIGLFGTITATQRKSAQEIWNDARTAQKNGLSYKLEFIKKIQEIMTNPQSVKGKELHKNLLEQLTNRMKTMIDVNHHKHKTPTRNSRI